MKRCTITKKLYSFLLLIVTLFVHNNVECQNKIVLYMGDSIADFGMVDSVRYGLNSDSLWTEYIFSRDTTYAILVDAIDSMKYYGPYVPVGGVVKGAPAPDDSLLVATVAEVATIADSSFVVSSFASNQRQLIAVTNLDTVPIMLYCGNIDEDTTVVIDSFSTVMALIMAYPPLAIRADTNYALFVSEASQTDSFNVLCQYVGQSVSAGRALADTLNRPMYIALADVISQMAGFEQTEPSKSNYYMGNHTMLVQTSGPSVQMRMWDLNPTYIGTVTDANGNVLANNLRVPARADYGIMDIFHMTAFGEYTTFDMLQGGSGAKYFDLSCKSMPAKLDFYLSAFVLPALNFCNLPSSGCIRTFATGIAQSMMTSYLDNVLRTNSANPLNHDYISMANQAVTDLIMGTASITGLNYSDEGIMECISSASMTVIGGLLQLFNGIYNAGKMAINTCGRVHYYFHEAPDNISFCMEHYGSGSAHQCTTPGLICTSGNGQQGYADSLLAEPIVLSMNAIDDDGNRQERTFDLHVRVASGDGWVSDTLFSVTTSVVYDVQRQFQWRLGPDSTAQQRVVAWLTDPTAYDAPISSPLTIDAFFHQENERIDSFKVAANRYVTFSSGNLQYQPSSSTWRFAEHQYDMIGSDNMNISNNDNSYTGWIDLFSWATANMPTFVPINNSYYDNGASTFYDWGVHPISNGGAQANMWRTPTMSEWYYLFNHRPNADSLYTYATVCNVHGMILLPDNWVLPDSAAFVARQHNWTTNVYDSIQWETMEQAGAVFLPAAGFRYKPQNGSLSVMLIGNAGAYWSANGHTYYPTYGYTPSQHAYRMDFYGTIGNAPRPMQSVECYWGQSVRLIRNL